MTDAGPLLTLQFQELSTPIHSAPQADLILKSVVQPDLTLWFDLPPTVAAQRLAGAREPDRFEAQPLAFFEAVRAGYARRAQADAPRFARIDADQPRAAVAQAVHAAVQTRGYV